MLREFSSLTFTLPKALVFFRLPPPPPPPHLIKPLSKKNSKKEQGMYVEKHLSNCLRHLINKSVKYKWLLLKVIREQ